MPNTRNQRRGQAFLASQNIRREAERIAKERSITLDEAEAAVFADRELLAKCHGVPRADELPKDWTEPK